MADPVAAMPARLSIAALVQCARREVSMRERVYPNQIARGMIRQGFADYELKAMRQIVDTLEWLQANEETVREAHARAKAGAPA